MRAVWRDSPSCDAVRGVTAECLRASWKGASCGGEMWSTFAEEWLSMPGSRPWLMTKLSSCCTRPCQKAMSSCRLMLLKNRQERPEGLKIAQERDLRLG